jgi:hypothetical protein
MGVDHVVPHLEGDVLDFDLDLEVLDVLFDCGFGNDVLRCSFYVCR